MNAQFLRPQQAAELLGISRATLYRMLADENAPLPLPRPVKISPQRVAFNEAELREWLELRKLLGV